MTGAAQQTIVVANPADSLILLSAGELSNLRQEAANNTPQWQAFKANLDQGLGQVAVGTYQASELASIADYALGYQVLKDSDPVTASKYADKAIAIMKSGLYDYQKGGWTQLQFLARGDGVTHTFTIPNADYVPGTVQVFFDPVVTIPVVRGTGGQDNTGAFYGKFLKVSNTPDGPAAYTEGTDWTHNPNYENDAIDWSGAAHQPAPGTTYYLTVTKQAQSTPTSEFTLNGTTLTLGSSYAHLSWDGTAIRWHPGDPDFFPDMVGKSLVITSNTGGWIPGSYTITAANRGAGTMTVTGTPATVGSIGGVGSVSNAPTASQAVYVQYLYGSPATDPGHAGLWYQQTSAGDGGFNSIMIDDSYTARSLGKYEALGLDWLNGYARFSANFKQQVETMLVRWADYLSGPPPAAPGGYLYNYPESNYADGSYVSLVMTGLALDQVGSPDGPRLLSEAINYRQTNVVPLLTNPTTSLKGGFWAEGWSYGQLASTNLILGGLVLEEAGQIPAATAERQWAGEAIHDLVSAQSTQATVFDGGDWFAYPSPFPGKSAIAVLGAAASDPTAQSYANYILQNYPGSFTSDYLDLLFHNPSATGAYWSAEPLADLATGTGLLTARSDWGSNPVWVATLMGNLLHADHQTHSPGLMEISRGADQLLVDGSQVALNNIPVYDQSTYSNALVVDDNGDGAQTYRYAMGSWYGTPGVVINAYEATANYTYLYGDYHAAYSNSSHPGGGGSTSELTRQVVYMRPDLIVVYDRVTTIKDSYAKQLRWHFLNAPTVSGNSFVETTGSSKLFGQTYSTLPLTTTEAPVSIGGTTVQEIITQNATTSASVRYVTGFQVAPSTTSSMVSSQHVLSADQRMEGMQMGNNVVLFGRNGDVDLTAPVSYQFTGSGADQHLLTNLAPGKNYQVTIGGVVVATVTASSQGTITFSTSVTGVQTVTVQAV
jgi:hypothetical protein